MNSESRRDVRKRTFLRGRILYNGGAASMDCIIRDMSESGARLELSETSALPEVFDLYIQNKDATFRAMLCWRRGGEVGVTFEAAGQRTITQPASDASVAALVRRVAELEAENAALRSLLTKMSQPTPASAA